MPIMISDCQFRRLCVAVFGLGLALAPLVEPMLP
jgi:hypothetical protein